MSRPPSKFAARLAEREAPSWTKKKVWPYVASAIALPAYAGYKVGKEVIDVVKKLPSAMKESPQLMTDAPSYMKKHGETALAAAGSLTSGSFLSKPKLATVRMGFPNIYEPKIKASIRKTMATEFKSRGKFTKGENVEDLVDYIVRGPWFHGRGTYPKAGETFSKTRIRTISSNLGEPTGISMSGDVGTAKQFHKRAAIPPVTTATDLSKVLTQSGKEYKFVQKGELARVTPLVRGAIKEKILPGWKAANTKKYQKVLGESYHAASKEVIDKIDDAELFVMAKDFGAAENPPVSIAEGVLKNCSEEFNAALTKNLQKRGYKGILYSPQRYNEYELKMFDPKDVLMMEGRTTTESSIRRLTSTSSDKYGGRQSRRKVTWRKGTDTLDDKGYAHASLGDIYEEYADFADIYRKYIEPKLRRRWETSPEGISSKYIEPKLRRSRRCLW